MDWRSGGRILWKKRWTLVIVPTVVMSIVFTVRYFGDWEFVSTAQVSTGITANKLIERSNRPGPDEMQIEFNNLIEVIKSPVVMNQVSYRLLRHDLPAASYSYRRPSESYIKGELGISLLANEELFGHILDRKLDSLSSLNAGSEDERLLQKVIDVYDYDPESILRAIQIDRLNNSDYLEVRVSSENPALSAFMANTICGELIRYYGNLQKNQSNVPLESLATTVLESKRNLDEKMSQLQAFSADNEMVNPAVESTSKISQLKNYEDRVSTERQNIRALELTIANFNVRVQDAELAASPQRINEEVGRIRRKINSLNERYITSGQSDQRILDSLTTWRSKLEQFNQRIAEAPRYTPAELKTLKDRREQAEVDLQIARENLNSLNRTLSSMRNNMGDYANKEATRKLMEEELTIAREEYLLAQSRYAAVKDKVLASNLEIKQAVYAEPAHKPKIKKAVALVGGSGVISFLLCAFILFLREAGDSRIRSAQRLRFLSKIMSIGQVPALPKSVKNPSWSFFLDSAQSEELSRMNDELRKIRFTMESFNAQVFLVTSTQKGQGKSFIVMALAYSLSLARKRTLIIDTNLRHNSLTRLLTARVNLKQSIEYYNNTVRQLTKGGDSQENITNGQGKLITNTYNEFVDVIGNKTSHLSPSEVIPGADFKVLLNWLKVRYDFILMEGSSLNDYSDSRELVSFADKVIPVFSAEATLNEEDREALHYLRSLNGKLGFGILNRAFAPEEISNIAAVL